MKNKKKLILPLDKFIEKSLYDKKDGYYMSKNPFGHKGDFITSPNISIFFSEMIAIWIISFWKNLNEPKKFNVIELGAGNGELINILSKTFKNFPKFEEACKIYIIEKSPFLKQIQKNKIKNKKTFWINDLSKIKEGPCIFLANEFFDALPINQYLKYKDAWYEKKVNFLSNGKIEYSNYKVNIKNIEKNVGYKVSKNQKILEISKTGIKFLKEISKLINKKNGGLLIIDYGYLEEKMKNTLRGMRNHKIVNILSNYKTCDITYSLSFNFLSMIAKQLNLHVSGITTQGNFLKSLGILKRAEIISKNLSFSKKADIYFRIEKLIDKKFMGDIFKVMLLTNSKINFKIGFPTDKI